MQIMEAAEEEIDAAVVKAYEEGYKAAMLSLSPELAAVKFTESVLREELEKERRKQRWFWPSVGISAGVSFAAGFFLHSLVMR